MQIICHMKLVAKPERDSAKDRYKLIECMFNACASLITYSIEVTGKMIKNNRRFTIHITPTVQKILRTCTGNLTSKNAR